MNTSLRVLAAAAFSLAASASFAQVGERPAYPEGQPTAAVASTYGGSAAAGTGASAASTMGGTDATLRASDDRMASSERRSGASRGWTAQRDSGVAGNHMGRPIIPGV